MPEIKIFKTKNEMKKFMKHKTFEWFKCFEYINRHGAVDYVLNYILSN